ncbi:tetratricopeptide repeat protein [Magnetospirillum sp. UT-4]|uniref:tetratricopeptide repeat protein n=1 Tax=Magnetospirillum sp. UT-4 TaxID=2681467 RepID=UPI00137CC889|nr:tetratricopeptide repeat protein [Magnetospirillum sp. UT-4]CAA7625683.1 conserved hypothetical protein [Magnetospirillum sp. UT-4]
MTRKLLDTAHLEVFHRPGPGGPLLVTFNELGMIADGTRFWGQAVCDRLNLDAVGIVSRRPNWFPVADMAQAVAALAPILARHHDIITYGHSQGGYGAVKYAAALRATRVAAFCPQWSIEPALLGNADRRFAAYHHVDLHAGMAVEGGDCPVPAAVVFDPSTAEDRWHHDRLAERVPVISVPVHHSGHAAVRLVAGAEPFGRFLDLLLGGGDLRAFFHGLRKASPLVRATILLRRAGQLEARGRGDAAQAAAEAAAQAAPDQFETAEAALQVMRRLGRHDAALGRAEALVARWPDSHLAWMHLAQVRQDRQDWAGAEAALARAIALRPEISGLHLRLSILLERTGRDAAALAAARHAVELNPAIAHNHVRLAECLLQAGRTDEALAAMDRALALAPDDQGLVRWRDRVRRG